MRHNISNINGLVVLGGLPPGPPRPRSSRRKPGSMLKTIPLRRRRRHIHSMDSRLRRHHRVSSLRKQGSISQPATGEKCLLRPRFTRSHPRESGDLCLRSAVPNGGSRFRGNDSESVVRPHHAVPSKHSPSKGRAAPCDRGPFRIRSSRRFLHDRNAKIPRHAAGGRRASAGHSRICRCFNMLRAIPASRIRAILCGEGNRCAGAASGRTTPSPRPGEGAGGAWPQ